MPRGTTGRILPHERDTNDDVPIIGQDVAVQEDHLQKIKKTSKRDKEVETKRDYRNRLKHIYEFFQKEYPQYCEAGGVVKLTDEELADDDKFYYKNKYDLKYEGLNVEFFKAFISVKKTKKSGNTSSLRNL